MTEITKVILENEMDLILAHKQSMRLAELTGLPLSAQTTFATAVSEVSRDAIGTKQATCLTLYVSDKKERLKFITAVLEDERPDFAAEKEDGYIYAKRLVSNISTSTSNGTNRTELNYRLPLSTRTDDETVSKWQINLNTDPAVSPYEEIKRKNRQLVEMADKLRESEQQYKTLTDSLPIMIFTMNNSGSITYANEWLRSYSGQTVEEVNANKWKNIVHPDDYEDIWSGWEQKMANPAAILTPERRLKDGSTGEYRWHTGVSIAITDDAGNVTCWNTFMVDIHAQKMIERALLDNVQLKEMHAELEDKVTLLNQSNQQLEQFAYVTSHDLQEPLRKISFYSDLLKNRYRAALPPQAVVFFDNLISATDRMKILVQDVLAYSTVHSETFTRVDLNQVTEDILQDLEITIEEKSAQIEVGKLPEIEGNLRQLKQLFENLVSNALKFSKQDEHPSIKISAEVSDKELLLAFTDHGIGFDEKYMEKMFDLFQQLHPRDKYKGTGIGLALCKKIVDLHKGSITAKGTPGQGATFLITLPLSQQHFHNN